MKNLVATQVYTRDPKSNVKTFDAILYHIYSNGETRIEVQSFPTRHAREYFVMWYRLENRGNVK